MKNKKSNLSLLFRHTRGQQGFSLIEVLVAVSILILSVTGTLTIASRSVAISAGSREQVTASFLAEEAIEFIRNTRDNNVLDGSAWLKDLEQCVDDPDGCTIDIPNNDVKKCTGACPAILITSGGVYNHDLGTPTVFTRKITIEDVVTDQEVIARVTMTWQRQLVAKTFTVEENLFNWQE